MNDSLNSMEFISFGICALVGLASLIGRFRSIFDRSLKEKNYFIIEKKSDIPIMNDLATDDSII